MKDSHRPLRRSRLLFVAGLACAWSGADANTGGLSTIFLSNACNAYSVYAFEICGPENVDTEIFDVGAFSAVGTATFPGNATYGPSSVQTGVSTTYDFAALTASVFGSIRSASNSPTMIFEEPFPVSDSHGPFAAQSEAVFDITYNDRLTFFDPSMPVGAPLSLQYFIPLEGHVSHASNDPDYFQASYAIRSGGNAFLDELTGSVQANVDVGTVHSGTFQIANGDIVSFGQSIALFFENDAGIADFDGIDSIATTAMDFATSVYFETSDPLLTVSADSEHAYRLVRTAVPEPGPPALLLAGALAALASSRWRARSVQGRTRQHG